ncbi:MAG: hypothetical protein JHC61_13140 [Burkholderiaceae bacterium]|nr:hypothetical protein [Burkholderiaceae bacterium]
MPYLKKLIAVVAVLICTAAGAANAPPDQRDRRQPYPVENNVYMVSLVPPGEALELGFPESELSDHIQTFLAGTPPRHDRLGNAAFLVAFSRFGAAAGVALTVSRERSIPVYVYAIAGDAYWYPLPVTIRSIRRSNLSYESVSQAAEKIELSWMRRTQVFPHSISYVVGFNPQQGIEIRPHILQNGTFYLRNAYPGTRDQDFIEDLRFYILVGGISPLLTFNLECTLSGPGDLNALSALASPSADRCTPPISRQCRSAHISRNISCLCYRLSMTIEIR